ncbi:MAG: hypothetical protein ABI645_11640 [Pseudomonadota bacterium]
MRWFQPPFRHVLAAACFTLTGACAQDAPETSRTQAAPAAGCLTSGDGSLEAQLRGALLADLAWKNAEMLCDGSPQPDGTGIRITIAGPLPESHAQLRFIFGIDLHDTASGVAQAFPTNLTAIVEGNQELYATRGTDKCAVETLQRKSVAGSNGKLDRVKVRGYCIGPASDITGNARLLVPTFSFTALLRNGDDP